MAVIYESGGLSDDLLSWTSSSPFNSPHDYRERRFDKSRRATFALYRPRRGWFVRETMDEGGEDSLESKGAAWTRSSKPRSTPRARPRLKRVFKESFAVLMNIDIDYDFSKIFVISKNMHSGLQKYMNTCHRKLIFYYFKRLYLFINIYLLNKYLLQICTKLYV